MVRMRLAVMFFFAGLGLACGCSSLSNHSWFNRNRGGQAVEVPGCDGAAPYPASGAMIDPATGPYLTAPPAGVAPTPMQTAPPPQLLQTQPGQTPQRIVPQAPPTPYQPAK